MHYQSAIYTGNEKRKVNNIATSRNCTVIFLELIKRGCLQMSRRRFSRMRPRPVQILVIWRDLAQYINTSPPCMASRCRNFEGGGPKETAKEEENKKNKDPEAQKTDEIEPKILAKNLEEVKAI